MLPDSTQNFLSRLVLLQRLSGNKKFTLEGEPYALRKITRRAVDIEALVAIDGNPAALEYMSPPHTHSDISSLAEFASRGMMGHMQALVYAITPKESDEMIGWIALYPDELADAVFPRQIEIDIPVLELSVVKVPDEERKWRGVGKSGITLLVAMLRELTHDWKKVESTALPKEILLSGYVSFPNKAVEIILERAGMKKHTHTYLYAPHDPCQVFSYELKF